MTNGFSTLICKTKEYNVIVLFFLNVIIIIISLYVYVYYCHGVHTILMYCTFIQNRNTINNKFPISMFLMSVLEVTLYIVSKYIMFTFTQSSLTSPQG